MFTKVLKWVSIAGMLLAVIFWNSAGNYHVVLNLLIGTAAALVVVQAVQQRKYGWAAGFVVIAVAFNPAVPVVRLTGNWDLATVLLSIAAFAVSLEALNPRPLLSVPSITDRTPGSVSL